MDVLTCPSDFATVAHATPARERGFSLVELMVGILVSVICTLAIMTAFAVYEGHKRTTTSSNDAQQNGSYSVYQLERQIRSAGSGIVQGDNYSVWGCPITAFTSNAQVLPATKALPAPFANWPVSMLAMPVVISYGGAGATPDTIAVIGGNPAYQVFKVGVTSTPAVNTVVVGNAFGIQANDYLLGVLPGGDCAVAQATTITANTNITLATANSPTTGLVNAVNVFDLGAQPNFTLFGVDTTSNTLVSYDLLQRPIDANAPSVIPVSEGVITLKTLYGVHTSGAAEPADEIDAWVQPTGAWAIAALTANTAAAATAVSEIKAIRVAVVAQSRLPERASDYVGPANVKLFTDQPAADQYVIPLQTQYRYKVYDTTIPLRNSLITTYF
jgi:type IV pilus assembly protein PilW